MNAPEPPRSPRSLPAAAFLACSWTWCVGMWLPVYLIHDFGAWGWLAFAIPNVVGAAAVGFIHRTPKAAHAFTQRSLEPMRWFSLITILFHLAFLSWIFREHQPPPTPGWTPYTIAPLTLLFAAALSFLNTRAIAALAIPTLLAAPIIMLAALWTTQGQGLAPPPLSGAVTNPAALPLYAVGLAFGFLLCPHLDLSILRIRKETPGPAGDAAFLLGFGALFLTMIAFTALYASGILLGWFSYYLLLHFFIQATFTTAAHLRELREHKWPRALGPKPLITFAILAAACVALAPISELPQLLSAKPNTRVAYESFIWFYALPFPAAAWFLLRRRPLRAPFWISLLIATPLMTAGALFAVWWTIPIAAAIPIASGFLAPMHR